MSELNFPKNPVPGQEYVFNDLIYAYDGVKWVTKSVGYNSVRDLYEMLTSDAGASFVGTTSHDNVQASLNLLHDMDGYLQTEDAAIRAGIKAFSGNLAETAAWANVPKHSDPDLGSALDAQSKALMARTELLKSLTGFTSREDFVSSAHLDLIAEGTVIAADGLLYVKRNGSTAIADLPNFEPFEVASPRHWGIFPSETVDQTAVITSMLQWTDVSGRQLDWDDGMYRFTSYLSSTSAPKVKWRTKGRTVLYSTKTVPNGPGYEDDYFIRYRGTLQRSDVVTDDFYAGGSRITIGSTAGIVPGTLVQIQTSRTIECDSRGQGRHGFAIPVSRVISPTVIEFQRTLPTTCNITPLVGTVVSFPSPTALVVIGLEGQWRSAVRYTIRFDSGAAAGLTARITDFDIDTQTLKCDSSNSKFPAEVAPGDTFTIVREASVSILHAMEFDVQGAFELRRPFHTNAVAGELGFRGLFIERADRPIVDGLTIRDFSETGLRVGGWCYAPTIQNIEVYNANRAYNAYDGTGYAVSVFQSSYGVFKNIIGYGCRRTLDFGGTQGVSYYNETENVQGYGGGESYVAGERFFPMGSVDNSVVGSHGGAVGTLYKNSFGQDVTGILNCRGDAESVRGIYGTGAIDHMINSFYGDGLDVDGVYYRDIGFDWGITRDRRLQPSESSEKLAHVIRIAAYNINPSRAHNIRNIDVRGVTHSIVSLEGVGTVGPITIQNASVITDDEETSNTTFDYIRNTGGSTVTFGGNIILDNVSVQNNLSAPKERLYIIQVGSRFVFAPNVFIKLPTGQVMVGIDHNSSVKLPTTRTLGATLISMRAHASNRPWSLINALVWSDMLEDHGRLANTTATGVSGIGSSTTLENSYGVDILDTILTGTTGADGMMSISFNPDSTSDLHVENRTGEYVYAIISCDALAA